MKGDDTQMFTNVVIAPTEKFPIEDISLFRLHNIFGLGMKVHSTKNEDFVAPCMTFSTNPKYCITPESSYIDTVSTVSKTYKPKEACVAPAKKTTAAFWVALCENISLDIGKKEAVLEDAANQKWKCHVKSSDRIFSIAFSKLTLLEHGKFFYERLGYNPTFINLNLSDYVPCDGLRELMMPYIRENAKDLKQVRDKEIRDIYGTLQGIDEVNVIISKNDLLTKHYVFRSEYMGKYDLFLCESSKETYCESEREKSSLRRIVEFKTKSEPTIIVKCERLALKKPNTSEDKDDISRNIILGFKKLPDDEKIDFKLDKNVRVIGTGNRTTDTIPVVWFTNNQFLLNVLFELTEFAGNEFDKLQGWNKLNHLYTTLLRKMLRNPCDFEENNVNRIRYLQHNFHAVFLIKDIFSRLKLHDLFALQKLLSQNPKAIIPEKVSDFTAFKGLVDKPESDSIGNGRFPIFFAKDLYKYNDLVTVNYSELYPTSADILDNEKINKNDKLIVEKGFGPLLSWEKKDLSNPAHSDVYN